MDETTWIYGLLCPLAKKIRYVGASCDPVLRYKAHVSPSSFEPWRAHDKGTRGEWLSSLLEISAKPELVLLEEVSGRAYGGGGSLPRHIRDAEFAWMRKLMKEGHPLTNAKLPPDDSVRSDEQMMQEAVERGRDMFGED